MSEKVLNLNLGDTVELMGSSDYKERFVAEYWQTKIRYEKLKAFNNKIEAARSTSLIEDGIKKLEMPKHDCPGSLLVEQQHHMGLYLHVLEVRAEIEGIDLLERMADYLMSASCSKTMAKTQGEIIPNYECKEKTENE